MLAPAPIIANRRRAHPARFHRELESDLRASSGGMAM